MTQEAKVLLNAASVVVGGGIQVVLSFIRHVMDRHTGLQWHFVLSRQVVQQLVQFDIWSRELGADVFDAWPARDKRARRMLREIERRVRPALVFTFFGPAYVRFRSPHLCGVGDACVTHASSMAYRALGGVREPARMFLQCVYKGLWFRAADRWLVEEQSARQGLSRRYPIAAERIAVISNGCADHCRLAGRRPRCCG